MPDGLLQLASTIFLTFGLGTLLYAIVTYFLKQLVGDEPGTQPRRTANMAYGTGPRQPHAGGYNAQQAMYPPQYPSHGAPYRVTQAQHHPGYAPPVAPPAGYPAPGPWTPPGAPPRA